MGAVGGGVLSDRVIDGDGCGITVPGSESRNACARKTKNEAHDHEIRPFFPANAAPGVGHALNRTHPVMMKRVLFLLSLMLMPSTGTAADSPVPRPNVVLIVADDLGYGDLGCYGCKDIPTPHLDSLARDGARFTDGYAYNVCSPTRAALITGKYASRSGINTVLMGKSVERFAKATTLARVLKDAGYKTGLVGKWHLGYDGDVVPTKMGYDEFFGCHGGKIDYFKHTDSTQKDKHELWEGEREVFMEGYSTDLFTDRAVQFLHKHAKEKFFLQITYNAPHFATKKGVFQAPEAYLKKFKVEGSPDGTRGGYAAMVNCMDDGVGRVLGALKELGVERETLVIFISDNGSELVGSNAPFSGGKHSNKEGGIRVPWLARWPGTIPPGSVVSEPVHVIDVMPTLLAVTDTPAPKGLEFDGRSFWPAVTGKGGLEERTLFFPPSAVRRGEWKLNGDKLYQLKDDPAEKKNVATQHPEVRDRLAKEMETWRTQLGIKAKIKTK